MTELTLKTAGLSIVLSLLLGPFWIKCLKNLKMKQYVREDGPEKHLEKAGVPTMGGIIFLFSFFLSTLFFSSFGRNVFFVLISTFSFAAVGFIDDFGKIRKKQNEGLSVKGKFVFIFLASVVLWFLFLQDFSLSIPFTNIRINNVFLTVLFISLIYSAVTNATNFTDGLDGLLASVTLIISCFYIYVSIVRGNDDLLIMNVAFAASLFGYLFYNWFPAKVFMGDFGSLAIGGYVVANALILDIYWFIPLFGIWYVIEVSSVIIQVAYFKKTKKRFFKMAPYHHHLELTGLSEVKVVLIAVFLTLTTSIISSLFI